MKNAGTKGLERRMTTVRETDVTVGGGRVLHAYDTAGAGLPVFWHHGTPNVGAPPYPGRS